MVQMMTFPQDREPGLEVWTGFWRRRAGLIERVSFIQRVVKRIERSILRRYTIVAGCYVPSGGTVLDAGSGPATASIFMGSERGVTIIALDYCRPALDVAVRRASVAGVRFLAIEHDITRRFPLADKSVDLAWNQGTLEHFHDPLPIVREMRRVGRVTVCIVPQRSVRRWPSELLKRFVGLEVWGYHKHYAPDELGRLFAAAGFGHIRVETLSEFAGMFPSVVAVGSD